MVVNGTLQGFQRRCAGLVRLFSHVHLDLIIEGGKEVHLSVVCIFRLINNGEVCLDAENITVVGGHLGRTVDDRGAQFKYGRIGERLEYQFIADSVGITVRDGHANFPIFHCSEFLMYRVQLPTA